MSDHMLQRANMDGRDNNLQEPSSKIPLIFVSLSSDPNRVTVLPRSDSKQKTELEVIAIFNLSPSDFIGLMLKGHTNNSDGFPVWADIPAAHWTTVVRDGDELRVFTVADPPPWVGFNPQWSGIPATIVYNNHARILLLSATYKETKDRIFERLKHVLPPNSTSNQIRLRLVVNTPVGGTAFAALHQDPHDSDDDWRALLTRLHRDWGSLKIKLTHLKN
ncbi:hypothetical protein D9619_012467 [Psilocybe cf. subviscida]|uniref:Uncharacterized protein n=1 Tax=Psilocybe cf. subviscida TaxID=2480587 RepID=A0A8H5ARK2_9AGAR|nr:hypothetical protein D9619_012467 [Psilocybe cf. subviscida]